MLPILLCALPSSTIRIAKLTLSQFPLSNSKTTVSMSKIWAAVKNLPRRQLQARRNPSLRELKLQINWLPYLRTSLQFLAGHHRPGKTIATCKSNFRCPYLRTSLQFLAGHHRPGKTIAKCKSNLRTQALIMMQSIALLRVVRPIKSKNAMYSSPTEGNLNRIDQLCRQTRVKSVVAKTTEVTSKPMLTIVRVIWRAQRKVGAELWTDDSE